MISGSCRDSSHLATLRMTMFGRNALYRAKGWCYRAVRWRPEARETRLRLTPKTTRKAWQ